jgi:hypothetical protein
MDGVPLYDIQALLGHESFATTQRYAHLALDAHSRVIESWSRRSGARVGNGECQVKVFALVGLGGLEPPTSSLSGMAVPQVSGCILLLTCAFIPQGSTGCPTGIRRLDARLTHG